MIAGYHELPPTWRWVRVDEVGSVQLGRQRAPEHRSGEHMRPYLRVANVYENWIDTSDVLQMNFIPTEAEKYLLRYGDILLNEGQSRELVGRPAMFRDEVPGACFQNTLIRFRSNQSVLPNYALSVFRYYLHAGHFQATCKWTTNIAHLGAERFAAMPFPLAPLPEQKRIASKLDNLLARVDACRVHLERVPAILKRFRQSVLAAATSGELTRQSGQDRAGSAQRSGWASTSLEALCEAGRVITYGVVKLGGETEGGVPCLRTSNVRWLRIDTEGMKRITPALSAEYARTVLRGGEVLVNVRGTLGGVAVATPEMRGWNVSREVAVVPPDLTKVDSTFLSFWIGAERSQRWLGNVEKGIAYTGINIADLRKLPVLVPHMQEQREIVRRVKTRFAFADQLEVRYEAALQSVERWIPSILSKAFRGELVPQDPNDEPASELLAKLKAQRSASAAEPSRRRPKAPGKRPTMRNTDKEAIKAAILKLKTDSFSFDELRAQLVGDYDSLKDALFELLDEPTPVVRQVFDKKAKTMHLVRVRP